MVDKKDIGKNLKKIRKAKGITREQLAEQLDISIYTLAKYEQGQRELTLSKALRIIDALGIELDDLIKP